MRCEEVRDLLLDRGGGDYPVPVRDHLLTCSACEAWAQDWGLLRLGFSLLAQEPAPEASLGFQARLMRRLEEAHRSFEGGGGFLETVGRRFVYAAVLLTLSLLLALTLPASGPLRAPGNAEIYLAQPEAITAQNEALFPEESANNLPDVPVRPTRNGEPGQK